MQTPKTFAVLSAIVFSLVAGSAVAGPDWSAIERARAAKQAENAKSAGGADPGSNRAGYTYGPRAPYSPPWSVTPVVAKQPTPRGAAGRSAD